MVRVTSGKCEICEADAERKSLYRCSRCREIFCELGFKPKELEMSKMVCHKCRLGEDHKYKDKTKGGT